jgi:hypothetical protein
MGLKLKINEKAIRYKYNQIESLMNRYEKNYNCIATDEIIRNICINADGLNHSNFRKRRDLGFKILFGFDDLRGLMQEQENLKSNLSQLNSRDLATAN